MRGPYITGLAVSETVQDHPVGVVAGDGPAAVSAVTHGWCRRDQQPSPSAHCHQGGGGDQVCWLAGGQEDIVRGKGTERTFADATTRYPAAGCMVPAAGPRSRSPRSRGPCWRRCQRAEPRPGRRRPHRSQAGVARRTAGRLGLAEYRLERGSPAIGQGHDPQRTLHLCRGCPGRQSSASTSATVIASGPEATCTIPSLHGALTQHPDIEPRPVMGDRQRGHPRVVHPDPDPVTGDPRLSHLEHRFARRAVLSPRPAPAPRPPAC